MERRCDGLSDRISPTQGQTVPWRLSAPQLERTPQTLAGLSKPARALLSVEGGGRETKQRDSSTLLARYSPAKVLGLCAALDKYPMQHCWQWKGSQGTTRLACASEHLPGKCVAPWQTRDPAAASWLQPTKKKKKKIHYHQCTGGGLRKGGYVQPDHGSGPPLPWFLLAGVLISVVALAQHHSHCAPAGIRTMVCLHGTIVSLSLYQCALPTTLAGLMRKTRVAVVR